MVKQQSPCESQRDIRFFTECYLMERTPVILCLQLTTGCASISLLNGMLPAFHGTILVQNSDYNQSVTLEFQERSAWRMLSSNRGIKNGVRLYLQCPLGSFTAYEGAL